MLFGYEYTTPHDRTFAKSLEFSGNFALNHDLFLTCSRSSGNIMLSWTVLKPITPFFLFTIRFVNSDVLRTQHGYRECGQRNTSYAVKQPPSFCSLSWSSTTLETGCECGIHLWLTSGQQICYIRGSPFYYGTKAQHRRSADIHSCSQSAPLAVRWKFVTWHVPRQGQHSPLPQGTPVAFASE